MNLLESFMKTQAPTTEPSNAWQALENTALALGLELPQLDPVFKEKLQAFGKNVYATEESVTESTILQLIEAVEQKEVPDYCLLKFEEHGIASNILHFCMVQESLAVFLSLPYGGIEKEIQALQLTAANSMLRLLRNIKNQIKTQAHKIKPKQRLLIVENKRHTGNNGWGWIQPGQKLEWHPSRTPVVDVLTQGQLFS